MSNKKNQAVIIIHGMGEQKPMDSLRGFVEAVWSSDEDVQNPHISGESTFSKPDYASRSFELRRLTTVSGLNGWRTDFFEFYWAHQMHSTSLSHLLDWFRFLMLRQPKDVPRSLLLHYTLLWLIGAVYVVLAYATVTPEESIPRFASVTLAIFLTPALFWFLKNVLGDAARYLLPTPANVQRRQEIRQAGVSLLESLHEDDYERIVVVGHSLGSVVGYDILTHAWINYHEDFDSSRNLSTDELEKLEKITRELEAGPDNNGDRIDEFQEKQWNYFKELRENGSKWLVTDFITLGCPLTHAKLLLAGNNEEFARKLTDRELPRCPPVLEQVDHLLRFSYQPRNESGKKIDTYIPHHAAVFAPTQWTNIFFPVKNLLWGDFIAGPLRGVLGQGIRDVSVSIDGNDRSGFFSHTRYWKLPIDGSIPPYLIELRRALDIANNRAAVDEAAAETAEDTDKLYTI